MNSNSKNAEAAASTSLCKSNSPTLHLFQLVEQELRRILDVSSLFVLSPLAGRIAMMVERPGVATIPKQSGDATVCIFGQGSWKQCFVIEETRQWPLSLPNDQAWLPDNDSGWTGVLLFKKKKKAWRRLGGRVLRLTQHERLAATAICSFSFF